MLGCNSNKSRTGVFGFLGRRFLFFLAGIALAIICFVAIEIAMRPVSTNSYCGSMCHEMNTAYQTWELSPHRTNSSGVTVGCVDCHLPPREDYFSHLSAKAYAGMKDLYHHKFGPEYDIKAIGKRVAGHMENATCLHCHNSLESRVARSAARIAHMAAVRRPELPENKCVTCHEDAGHQRINKLFSP